MYDVEIDRLKQFIEEYEEIQKTPVIKAKLNIVEKSLVAMTVIDFCCICEQDGVDKSGKRRKNIAAWHNKKIDEFVCANGKLYNTMKTLRDSFVAHIDHTATREEKVDKILKSFGLLRAIEIQKFYSLCKRLLKEESVGA